MFRFFSSINKVPHIEVKLQDTDQPDIYDDVKFELKIPSQQVAEPSDQKFETNFEIPLVNNNFKTQWELSSDDNEEPFELPETDPVKLPTTEPIIWDDLPEVFSP